MKTQHQNKRLHLHPRIIDLYFCLGGGFWPPLVVSIPLESVLGVESGAAWVVMLSVVTGVKEVESLVVPDEVLLSLQLNNTVEKRKAAAKMPAIVLVLF